MKILGWSSNGKKKGESGWEKVSVITMVRRCLGSGEWDCVKVQ